MFCRTWKVFCSCEHWRAEDTKRTKPFAFKSKAHLAQSIIHNLSNLHPSSHTKVRVYQKKEDWIKSSQTIHVHTFTFLTTSTYFGRTFGIVIIIIRIVWICWRVCESIWKTVLKFAYCFEEIIPNSGQQWFHYIEVCKNCRFRFTTYFLKSSKNSWKDFEKK